MIDKNTSPKKENSLPNRELSLEFCSYKQLKKQKTQADKKLRQLCGIIKSLAFVKGI
jgi:hypothetical protein